MFTCTYALPQNLGASTLTTRSEITASVPELPSDLPLPLLPSLAFLCSGGTIQTTSSLAGGNYAVVEGPSERKDETKQRCRRGFVYMTDRLRTGLSAPSSAGSSCLWAIFVFYPSLQYIFCSWLLICLYTHSHTPHTLFCSGCLQGRPLPWQACVQSGGVNLASAHSNGGWFKWRPVGWKDTYVKQVKLTRTCWRVVHTGVLRAYMCWRWLYDPQAFLIAQHKSDIA